MCQKKSLISFVFASPAAFRRRLSQSNHRRRLPLPSTTPRPQPSSPSAIHHSQTSVVVSLCHPPLPALRPQPYTIFGRRITRTIQQIIVVFSLRHPPLAFDFPPSNHSNNPTARRHPLSSSSYHLVCLLNYHPPSSSSKRFLLSLSKVIPSQPYIFTFYII